VAHPRLETLYRRDILSARRSLGPAGLQIREVHSRFIPNKVLLRAESGTGQAFLAQHLPFLKNASMVDGKATAYICENYSCQLPITDSNILATMLTPRTFYDVSHADIIDKKHKL